MEITWYGHACFRLKGRQGTVITDPYDKTLGLSLPNLKADIITVSHDSPHHNYVKGVKGDFQVVDRSGEYEISDIFITGIYMPASKTKVKESTSFKNNIFVIDLDDITICHLGDLNHVPTQEQVEDMGNIDVLLIPVGGQQALNAAQAAEVISLVEPYLVVPMHYSLPNLSLKFDPVGKFLKEMGIAKEDTEDSLKVTKSSLPDESQVVVLASKG